MYYVKKNQMRLATQAGLTYPKRSKYEFEKIDVRNKLSPEEPAMNGVETMPYESVLSVFKTLKLSEENKEKIIELGLNFVDDFRIYYFCNDDEAYYDVYARLGIAYYMRDDYENAVKYLEGNKKVLNYVNGKKVSFKNYIEKEAAFVCKIASTMLKNKREEAMVEEVDSLKKPL